MKVCDKERTVLFCTWVPRSVTSWRPSWHLLQTWAGKKSHSSLIGHQVCYILDNITKYLLKKCWKIPQQYDLSLWLITQSFWSLFNVSEAFLVVLVVREVNASNPKRVGHQLLICNIESIFATLFMQLLFAECLNDKKHNWAFSHNQKPSNKECFADML